MYRHLQNLKGIGFAASMDLETADSSQPYLNSPIALNASFAEALQNTVF